MAKKRPNLLVNLPFPLKGWDTSWSRVEQPPRTSPDLLNVLPYDKNLRARGAKRPGFSVLAAGSLGTLPTLYREARLCGTDVFAGIFVAIHEIGAYPYTFKYTGNCYHVESTDDTTETPVGFIPPLADRTQYTDCTACLAPPPPPSDHWYKLRRCSDNVPVLLWVNAGDLSSLPPTQSTLLRTSDGICYKVTDTFFWVGASPGPVVGAFTLKDDCTACAGDAGTGSDTYYQAVTCADATPVDAWILASDVASVPFFFFRPDFLVAPVYIPGDATPTSSGVGTIYNIADVGVTGSCEQTAGCWEDTLPDTATVTLSGITLQTSCRTMNPDVAHSWKVTGTINTTFSLTKISEGSGSALYRAAVPGLTLHTYCDQPDCTGTDTQYTGFYIELTLTAGTPIGVSIQVYRALSSPSGPLAFQNDGTIRGTCRQTFTMGNGLATRNVALCGEAYSDGNFIGSGGSAVFSLDF